MLTILATYGLPTGPGPLLPIQLVLSKSRQSGRMQADGKLLVAAAMVKFLQAEVASDHQQGEQRKESLLVAASCISQAYGLAAKNIPPTSIPSLMSLAMPAGKPTASPAADNSATTQIPESMEAASAERVSQAEHYKTVGNQFLAEKRAIDAADAYTKAIELNPNNAVYYSNRAAAFTMQAEWEAALEDCQAAISLNPAYAKAYNRLGVAYAGLGNHLKAEEAHAKAVSLEPENSTYRSALEQAKLALQPPPNQTPSAAPRAGPNGGSPFDAISSFMNNPAMREQFNTLMKDPGAINRMMNDPNVSSMIRNMMGGAGSQNPPQDDA